MCSQGCPGGTLPKSEPQNVDDQTRALIEVELRHTEGRSSDHVTKKGVGEYPRTMLSQRRKIRTG